MRDLFACLLGMSVAYVNAGVWTGHPGITMGGAGMGLVSIVGYGLAARIIRIGKLLP